MIDVQKRIMIWHAQAQWLPGFDEPGIIPWRWSPPRLGHANPNITYDIYAHAMPADQKAAAILWGNATKEAIEDSRKEAVARKRGALANVSAKSEKIRVIPIKSAS
jgi:hypothetical protein